MKATPPFQTAGLVREPVVIAPLCGATDVELSAERVATFDEQVRRALANGQEVNVFALIPPEMQQLLDMQLGALDKPTLENSTIDELLNNLHGLTRTQKGTNIGQTGEADRMKAFFKQVALFLGRHNYFPVTIQAMVNIAARVSALQKAHGLANRGKLSAFTDIECKPCLDEIFDTLRKRNQDAVHDTRLGAILLHMKGQATNPALAHTTPIRNLFDYCQQLIRFGGKIENLSLLVARVTSKDPTASAIQEDKVRDQLHALQAAGYKRPEYKRRDSSPGPRPSTHHGRALPEKSYQASSMSNKSPSRTQQVSSNQSSSMDNPATQGCTVCGRRNHMAQECVLRGSNHPMVVSLHGKSFFGSVLQGRLMRVQRLKADGSWQNVPQQCIPFRKRFGPQNANGCETLEPDEAGPAGPLPQTNTGKRGREDDKPPNQGGQVKFNANIEFTPPYFVTNDCLNNVFTSPSLETEERMTAEVCGDTSTGRRTLTLDKVLIDTGAIHYNYMSTECVRLHKFKRFNLNKAINIQSIHNVEISNQYVCIDKVLIHKDNRT